MSKVFEKITEKSRAELKIFPRVPKISKITKNLRDSKKVLKKAPKDSDKVLELSHKISKFIKTKKFRKVPKKIRSVPEKSRELPKQSRGSENFER